MDKTTNEVAELIKKNFFFKAGRSLVGFSCRDKFSPRTAVAMKVVANFTILTNANWERPSTAPTLVDWVVQITGGDKCLIVRKNH